MEKYVQQNKTEISVLTEKSSLENVKKIKRPKTNSIVKKTLLRM